MMLIGRIEFAGFGHYEPSPEEFVSVRSFLARQGTLEKPISEETLAAVGINTRVETSRSVLELALTAAQAAIRDAEQFYPRFCREDIAAIISGGTTPDRIVPGAAHQLQRALGLHSSHVRLGHDVSAACSSWTAAVLTLRGQMLANDYRLRYGLVCIPDRTGMDMAALTDRNSFLWGNGAGATILAYHPDGDPNVGIITSTGVLDGEKADWIVGRGALGVNPLIPMEERNIDFGDHGREIQKYVLTNLPRVISGHMESCDLRVTERTFLVPHNANLAMVNGVGQRIGIPSERVLTSLEEYGNTSGASIPITLSRYARTIFQSGDLLILASFGAGMMMQVIFYRWP